MKTIELNRYAIFLGTDWAPSLLRKIEALAPSRLVVLCDAHTRIYCLPLLQEILPVPPEEVITVPAGEAHKNLDTCRNIWSRMMEMQLDRRALVLNLGGGVIGDMGGFCASTFKRGLRFMQIPTTLLSQVDASIGGKLGIDFGGIKNSIGLFRDPEAVFIQPDFLQTLPERELRSGFAEMVKHSLIADAGQWEKIRSLGEISPQTVLPLLSASLQVKKEIVEKDPLENGPRKLLNFGHTVGHALESWFLSTARPLLHGEAIAAGMICEAYLSHLHLGLPLDQLGEIVAFVHRVFGTVAIEAESFPALIRLMENDKKNREGRISFSLLRRTGAAEWDQFCTTEAIQESLDFYRSQSLSLFTS